MIIFCSDLFSPADTKTQLEREEAYGSFGSSMAAGGDVAPLRILEGPDTGLGAGRVTTDPVHNLVITANATNSGVEGKAGIRIFDRTASGNTKPLRFITGQAPKTSG